MHLASRSGVAVAVERSTWLTPRLAAWPPTSCRTRSDHPVARDTHLQSITTQHDHYFTTSHHITPHHTTSHLRQRRVRKKHHRQHLTAYITAVTQTALPCHVRTRVIDVDILGGGQREIQLWERRGVIMWCCDMLCYAVLCCVVFLLYAVLVVP